MNSLIVAANKQISTALATAVKRSGVNNIALAFDAVSAKRMVADRQYGLIVIYSDIGGKGVELARTFATKGNMGVILIEAAKNVDAVASILENDGVIVLGKPISHADLFRAVKIVKATNNRIERLIEEKRDLLKKIDDMRLVNRAKLILMQNMGFTEEQAHRHIEKRSMDLRRTRAEVAMDILRTYEV